MCRGRRLLIIPAFLPGSSAWCLFFSRPLFQGSSPLRRCIALRPAADAAPQLTYGVPDPEPAAVSLTECGVRITICGMAFQDGFKMFPELSTERLVLRQLVPEDAEAYHQHLRTVSPDIWSLRYDTVEKTRTSLVVSQKGFRNKAAIRWAITHKEQNDLIGEIKLFDFVRGSKAETAYWLTENQRRQGFGFEAGQCAVKFAFEVLELHRVEAYAQPVNDASLALLGKLGFKKEGVLRKFRKEGEQWQDFVVFGLLREEY